MGDRLTAVVGDPVGLVRVGLAATLRKHDVEVVGHGGDLDELLPLLEEHGPDLAVVDLDLPGLDQHDDLVSPLRNAVADLKVIVVSDSTTDTAVVRAFRAYADGFVVKGEADTMLPFAVPAVMQGGTFVDPAVGGILVALVSKGLRSYDGPFGLTMQEQRVAALLGQGMTNRSIGEQLGITAGTVKSHVAKVMEKLGADDRYDAASIIEREGITAPGT